MSIVLPARFWAKVNKTDTCWLWTATAPSGYGRFRWQRKMVYAHRLAYEAERGAVASGLVVDHACRQTLCVRPSHLQAVTVMQNAENRRGARAGSKSGVRGVTWHAQNRQWRVRVRHAGVFYGGLFHDLGEAETAAIALRNRLMSNNLTDRTPLP